jgi:soluble lytic murein transglycosylase
MISPHVVPAVLFLIVAAGLSLIRPGEAAELSLSATALPPAPVLAGAGARAGAADGGRNRARTVLGEYLITAPAATRVAEPAGGWTLLFQPAAGFGRGAAPAARVADHRLLMLAAVEPAPAAQGLALLRRARTLAERRDVAGAVAAYDSAAVALPQLADWIDIFIASAAAATGDTAAVNYRLSHTDPELAAWAWRAEARARRQAGDRRGAIAVAEAAAASLDSPARRAAAWTFAAQLRLERGDSHGARVAWIRAINTAEGSQAALDAARALMELPVAVATDRLLAARVFLRHGNLPRAVAGFNAFLEAGAGSIAARERALYDLGDAAFRAGDFAAAERDLLRLAGSATSSATAADALFTAARAQFRAGRRDEAQQTLQRAVTEHPGTSAAPQAAFLAADLLHDAGDLTAASHFYRSTIELAPASASAAAAHMRLGGMAFADGRHDDALAQFETFRESHTTGRLRQQAAFWAGMSAARTGRDDVARQHFLDARDYDPFSYYGGLAADQLGEESWQDVLEHEPPHDERHVALALGALARVDALRAAGWDDAAAFEMERARRRLAEVDGALYALAEELHHRGMINTGVAIAWDIHRREGAWNMRLLRILYPFPYQDIIVAAALARDVDPFLAAALIRQESMFNPVARSHVGATGLMQVMPATARSIAGRVNVPRFSLDMLLRPDINVAFGTTYLADQLRVYGDRIDVVLAAYNAGPGRVSRWRSFPEFASPLLFAERIPFDETRDYVRIVQHNRRLYAALYSSRVHQPQAD